MLDWDDLRVFLAVSRHRTLSAAARQLHVTQSTVGRRLTAMQTALGVRLLQRTSDGFQLTAAGEAVLPKAERVEAAAREVELAVAGQDVRLEGTVRVATSQMVASHLLAAGFAALHERSAAIMVEVIARAPLDLLSTYQADISVQLARFEHHNVVVRRLGLMQFGLYGSHGYLNRYGAPDLESGSSGHQVVTLVDDMDLPQHAGWMAECVGRAQVVMKSDSYEMQHWAALNGSGLALLPRFRADAEPALRRVTPPVPLPPAEIWLGVHRENRHKPRVRIVLDTIAAAVRARAAELAPEKAHSA
jgi:DNA-binding transcriptional LysR family regulator